MCNLLGIFLPKLLYDDTYSYIMLNAQKMLIIVMFTFRATMTNPCVIMLL